VYYPTGEVRLADLLGCVPGRPGPRPELAGHLRGRRRGSRAGRITNHHTEQALMGIPVRCPGQGIPEDGGVFAHEHDRSTAGRQS
jgi:hypothetical protein